ncbi:MAG: hypothetical protein ACM3NQ_24750 [Bacteroidales bacterium]
MDSISTDDTLRVDPLMAELQAQVRVKLRARLRRCGKDTFSDQEIFDGVERVLRRALEMPTDALLLPELAEKPDAWRLDTAVRFTSHRNRWLSGVVLGIKRRLIMPLVQWLVDFDRVNFERQQALNETLLACVQALATEQAELRRELDQMRKRLDAPGSGSQVGT